MNSYVRHSAMWNYLCVAPRTCMTQIWCKQLSFSPNHHHHCLWWVAYVQCLQLGDVFDFPIFAIRLYWIYFRNRFINQFVIIKRSINSTTVNFKGCRRKRNSMVEFSLVSFSSMRKAQEYSERAFVGVGGNREEKSNEKIYIGCNGTVRATNPSIYMLLYSFSIMNGPHSYGAAVCMVCVMASSSNTHRMPKLSSTRRSR